MLKSKIFYLILLLLAAVSAPAFSQQAKDRPAYAAGKFYESDSAKLSAGLQSLFGAVDRETSNDVLAIISPHAGYAFSGEVAAKAFKQLDPQKKYKNIFIIGSSHTSAFKGASVYSDGNYLTPLGKVQVNQQLAHHLMSQNPFITFVPQAHQKEHILENQLPFLQFHLKNTFSIVPVSIGTSDENVLKSLAETFSPYLNDENLFVISADFSHYPRYADAQQADSATAYAIAGNSVKSFDAALQSNEAMEYPGLVTSTCGSTAIKMLLYITENDAGKQYIPLMYRNSGDAAVGDKNRVVGYFAMALLSEAAKDTGFLTAEDKSELLRVARLTLDEYLNKDEIPKLDPEQFSETLLKPYGAFVTLKKDAELRGCIGRFKVDQLLYEVVQQMAIAAATQDSRFAEVSPAELEMLDIEISVLTPLKKIDSINEIVPGRDGIYIVKGAHTGTYLPQVATDTGWNREELLGHCARDKAGIGWEGWKNADIYTYRAIVFGESDVH